MAEENPWKKQMMANKNKNEVSTPVATVLDGVT